jgi:hypothetical protein
MGQVLGDKRTGPGQFRLPHAIVADRNNNLYMGDRTNRRIQEFDTDGKFLRMFTIDVPLVPGTRAVNGDSPTSAAAVHQRRALKTKVHGYSPFTGVYF